MHHRIDAAQHWRKRGGIGDVANHQFEAISEEGVAGAQVVIHDGFVARGAATCVPRDYRCIPRRLGWQQLPKQVLPLFGGSPIGISSYLPNVAHGVRSSCFLRARQDIITPAFKVQFEIVADGLQTGWPRPRMSCPRA